MRRVWGGSACVRFRRKLHLRTLINLINLITLITLEMSRKKIPRRNTRRALEQYVTHARRSRDTSSFAYTFWARVPALLPHRCMSKHTHTHIPPAVRRPHRGGPAKKNAGSYVCSCLLRFIEGYSACC